MIMTKEEILAAIRTGIAGQGTNVDGGGYLPKILEAIVDALPEGGGNEPLIVKGEEREERMFTPTDGTTFQEAVSAFIAGRVVIIDYSDIDSIRYLKTAIEYTPDDSVLGFNNIDWYN